MADTHSAEPPRSIRAFLAVDFPPDLHAALVQLKHDLAATVEGVRWVRDEGLHATVKFLGNVAVGRLDIVRKTLAPIVGGFDAFTLGVHGLGAFPSVKRARVVWVGLDGDALRRLAAAVDAALEPLGFPPEGRPFRSHITLGRIAAPQAWARSADALKSRVGDDFGSCRITELAAYRSTPQRAGAVYTRLWAIELIDREGGCHGDGSES